MPSSYSTGIKSPAPPAAGWWKRFSDAELNRLMDETFSQNLDLEQAYERLRQSMAFARITGSSGGINLDIKGSGGRARQPGRPGAVEEDSFKLSAAASYEIDLWGELKSRTNASEFNALASEQDLAALYISISAQLADLYYLAIEQRAQMDLSERTIKTFQDTLERVESRYREGLVSAVDIYRSRQNLVSAKAQRPLFESRLATTLHSISVLTGKFPAGELELTANELLDPPAFQAGIPSQLLLKRPDVRAAFLRLQASDENVAAAIADRFPSLNLIGGYGGSSDEIRSVLDSPNIFWNILLQAAQPVLDAGRRKAEVDRADAAFRDSLAGYHKAILTAFKEVEDALAQGRATEKRIRLLKDGVSASEGELRLTLDNYLQGLTDYLPVLTAQQRFYNAKSALLTSKRRLISERIQLARALGGEWAENAVSEHLETWNSKPRMQRDIERDL